MSLSLSNHSQDIDMSTLSLQTLILKRWNDTRLKWNPEDFEGIENIFVQASEIWLPKIYLNDSYHELGLETCTPEKCLVTSQSKVACLFPCMQTVYCKGKLDDWPFDVQNCSFAIRTSLSSVDSHFEPGMLAASAATFTTNSWELTKGQLSIDVRDKRHLIFELQLRRHSGAFYKHIYVPGFVLITLTFAVLWMKHGSFSRSLLCGVSIYLHFSLMDRVWWQIPKNGSEVPRLMKYMSMMLISTTFVFIETILMKLVTQSWKVPPLWIQKFTAFLLANEVTKYLLGSPFDDADRKTLKEPPSPPTDVSETESESPARNPEEKLKDESFEDWTHICRLIDRIVFVVLAVVYKVYDGY